MILIMIFFVFVAPILGVLVEKDFFKGMWLDVIQVIPFGSQLGELAIGIFIRFISSNLEAQDYWDSLQQMSVSLGMLQEFCKLCLTAIFYSVVKRIGEDYMKLHNNVKKWSYIQLIIWRMFSAFVSAIIASMALEFAFSQINSLSSLFSQIWTYIITILIIVGAAGIYVYLLGVVIWVALGYMFVKIVFINGIQVISAYFFLLLMLLSLSAQTYRFVIIGFAIWGIMVIMVTALETIVTSAFE